MNYFCNPMNLEYRYQLFKVCPEKGDYCEIHREAADPSLVVFKGTYYLFPSMTAGFFTSQTMEEWEYHCFSDEMPIYDYAPDVRAAGYPPDRGLPPLSCIAPDRRRGQLR